MCATAEAVVLRQGHVNEDDRTRAFHKHRCQVTLQGDGNLLVRRLVAPNPHYQGYQTAWTGGSRISAGTVGGRYLAQWRSHDGSLLVVHCSLDEEMRTTMMLLSCTRATWEVRPL